MTLMDDWCPNSPDMNLIEHCWKRLKEKLHKRFPDTAKTRGGPKKVKERRAECLDIVWREDIERKILETLWKSMPRKVADLLKAKGWYTKY